MTGFSTCRRAIFPFLPPGFLAVLRYCNHVSVDSAPQNHDWQISRIRLFKQAHNLSADNRFGFGGDIITRSPCTPPPYAVLATPYFHRRYLPQQCQAEGDAPQAELPSAAQTQRAVFPYWAFTKAACLAGASRSSQPCITPAFTPVQPYSAIQFISSTY